MVTKEGQQTAGIGSTLISLAFGNSSANALQMRLYFVVCDALLITWVPP